VATEDPREVGALRGATTCAVRGVPEWLRPGESGRTSAFYPAGHRPVVVGVLNVTPDSFSDGGRFLDADAARAHVDRLLDEGADVIEVGGESTRPAGTTYGAGYQPVDAKTQIARTTPAIEHAAKKSRVAIDTTSPEVARAAIDAGATIVNDVSCMADPELARVCAEHGAWLVLMHSRPGASSHYDDVIVDVSREWSAARTRATEAGVAAERIVMDPGIGFGKDADANLRVLAGLSRFHSMGHPIYVGASRKAFIGAAEEREGLARGPADQRVGGTVAACLVAAHAGAAVLRVHDVRALRQALAVTSSIEEARHV
jgi:dihydropteroate synthase